jgi:hypothetical protein
VDGFTSSGPVAASVVGPAALQGGSADSWTVRGSGTVDGDRLTLREDSRVITTMSRPFVVPQNSTALVFTITGAAFQDNGPNDPPDAFEVALLDPQTLLPLAGTAAGLTNTDALLNIQPTGQVFVSPHVTVSGVSASGQFADLGQALTVTVDLHGLAPGTQGTLEFDLLGFGPTTSTVSFLMGTPTGGNGGGVGGGSGGSGGGGSNPGSGGGGSPGSGGGGSSGGGSSGGSSSGGTSPGQTGGPGSPGGGNGSGTTGGAASGGGALAGAVGATPETGGGSVSGGSHTAGVVGSLVVGSEGAAVLSGGVASGFVVATEASPFGGATGSPTQRVEVLSGSGGGSALQGDDASDAFWNWLGDPGRRGSGPGRGGSRQREGSNRPVGNEINDDRDDFWPWLRQTAPEVGVPVPQTEAASNAPAQVRRSVETAPYLDLGWMGVLAMLQGGGLAQARQGTRKRPVSGRGVASAPCD